MGDKKHTILLSVLDWGLGHATRMLPVITYLMDNGHDVIISSYGESHAFLKNEFPLLVHEYHEGIQVTYPKDGRMIRHMIKSMPAIIRQLNREAIGTLNLIRKYKPSLIISDNRYNVLSRDIYSIIITHQTNILSPYASKLVNIMNHSKINRFNECWIPDDDRSGLCGKLSETNGVKIPVHKIGPLSMVTSQPEKKIDYCFIISGPEPQRRMLAEKVNTILPLIENKRKVVISSLPFEFKGINRNDVYINPLRSISSCLIGQSKTIISRSGYSTIMDLLGTGAKALFIPTPGQTEQEYLAAMLTDRGISANVKQDELCIESIFSAERLKGFSAEADKQQFKSHLDRVLNLL